MSSSSSTPLNGRPSIAPEKLLRALLLQAFYSVRSERQLMEQLDYNLLFRWFVGLGVDDPVWDVTVFTKNRDRLLEGEIAAKFLRAVLAQPKVKALLVGRALLGRRHADPGLGVDEELPAEGRQRRAAGAGPQRRARLPRRAADQRHARLDHRPRGQAVPQGQRQGGQALLHGPCADGEPARAARRRPGQRGQRHRRARRGRRRCSRPCPGRHPITVGGDKGFDTAGFVAAMRELKVTPHVAQNTTNRRSAIDGRTTRHPGYAVSQRIRKRIEEAFGWIKEIALQRRARHRGKDRVGWQFTLAAAAYNLIRLPKLLAPDVTDLRTACAAHRSARPSQPNHAPSGRLNCRRKPPRAIRRYFRSLLGHAEAGHFKLRDTTRIH